MGGLASSARQWGGETGTRVSLTMMLGMLLILLMMMRMMMMMMIRVAKCHGYDGYIRVKISRFPCCVLSYLSWNTDKYKYKIS